MMHGARVTSPPPEQHAPAIAKFARASALKAVDAAALAALGRNARLVDVGWSARWRAAPGRDPNLLVLLSGHAAVFAGEKVVELPCAGEVIGEEQVFDASSRVTVQLLGQATALAVPADAVRRAVEFSPLLARALLGNLSARQLRIMQRVECRVGRRALARLAGFILRQLPARDAPQLLQFPAPKAIVASLLSMTKESLSRGLARLTDAALISVRSRQVRVPAPSRLAEAFDCPRSCVACDGIRCSVAPG